MKGKGDWHLQKFYRNHNLVYQELKKNFRIKARKIKGNLEKKHGEKAPNLRTIYRVLKRLCEQKLVRKDGVYYVYSPHDILRNRWLAYFDFIFGKIAAGGYSVEDFLSTQGIIITPKYLGFAPANPESMKKLVEFLWNPEVKRPSGSIFALIRTFGKIEKGAPIALIPKEEAKKLKERENSK